MVKRDSAEKLKADFLRLKKDLPDFCDDKPVDLYEIAKTDRGVRDHLVRLYEVADKLRRHELNAEGGKIAPVNEAFSHEWNDYRLRWEKPVRDANSYNSDPHTNQMFDQLGWNNADFQSVYETGTEDEISRYDNARFNDLIRKLKGAGNALNDADEAEEFFSLIENFKTLWRSTGFSAEGAFERIHLAPIALVSPKVNSKAATADFLSLYSFWSEARKAYILGLPLASIALSRAALETLLKVVHGADKGDPKNVKEKGLKDYIAFMEARGKLDGSKMHSIQRTANDILHGSNGGFSGKQVAKEPYVRARKILFDLKELIESSS